MGQCLCLQSREIEPPPVKLPWELEEEILTRLPPHSLVRFKTVCKRWDSLFNDKSFLTYHMSRSRPQFIFKTKSKIYSADIIDHNIRNPTIELRELPASSDIPHKDTMNFTAITTCDEFLFFTYQFWKNGTALWNPWLRQVKRIEYETYFKNTTFCISGLGYDNTKPQKVYKVLGYFFWIDKDQDYYQVRVAIYECASHTFTIIDTPDEAKQPNVSLNINLYWITSNREGPSGEYFILSFDFSTESFKLFCLLPCQMNHLMDVFILAVYERDRFSLLKQCYKTGKIDIWVTKKKIDIEEEEEVVWINFMTLPTNNLPMLFWMVDHISYLINGKTLFMCCGGSNRTDVDCIYIVREDICKQIRIGSSLFQCCHCVYTPNFISLP